MTNLLRGGSSVENSLALPFPEADSRIRLLLARVPRDGSAGKAEEEGCSADRSRLSCSFSCFCFAALTRALDRMGFAEISAEGSCSS